MRTLAILFLLAHLAACGGGDDEPEDDGRAPPPPPPINCNTQPRPPACL